MEKERVSYKDLYELIDRHITVVNNNVKENNTKLDHLVEKVEEVRLQTTKTNGRVNALEKWEFEVNQLITDLKADNKAQDKQIAVTNKDIAMISVKVAGILTVIGFLIYLTTGFVI